ncbi:MAG: alpha/beta hydrolase [Alphaproteobacteria bacterium]
MDWEGQFNPRAAVKDFEKLTEQRNAAADAVRGKLRATLDVPYGSGEREKVDIYRPAGDAPAPVQVYFHGGYWRGNSRADFPHLTPTFTDAGAVCVLAGYDLCPTVTLDDIVAQAYRCLAWIHRNIADHGGDPARIYVSGSSAGGHLTAMALARDWRQDGLPVDLIKGGAPITGVYDVAPVLNITVNAEIRLTADMVDRLSPKDMAPRHGGPVLVAVGGAETESWIGMSRDYAEMCRNAGCDVEYLEPDGLNHFTVTASIADPQSPLAQAMLRQMGLAG